MSAEIERKFLVTDLPDGVVADTGTRLRQGYLASEDDVEVRLRRADGTAWLTVKAGTGLVRTEVELPLEEAHAEALWPHTAGRRLEKTRHRVTLGALVAEIDVYTGDLAGLVVVEVEFADEEAARRFATPSWFGEEVTGVPAWSNASLARNGQPPLEEGGSVTRRAAPPGGGRH